MLVLSFGCGHLSIGPILPGCLRDISCLRIGYGYLVLINTFPLCQEHPEPLRNNPADQRQYPTGNEKPNRQWDGRVAQLFYAGGDAQPDEQLAGVDVGEQAQHGAVGGRTHVNITGPLTLGQKLSRGKYCGVAQEKPGDKGQYGVRQQAMFCQEPGKFFNTPIAHQMANGIKDHQQDHNGRENTGNVGHQCSATGREHIGKGFRECDHKFCLPCEYCRTGIYLTGVLPLYHKRLFTTC